MTAREAAKRINVEDLVPKTKYQRESNELYDICAQHYTYEEIQQFIGLVFSTVRTRLTTGVVSIQVYIGPAGGNYGVFVPVSAVDPHADDVVNYTGDKFSLMDLSALFNAYFWDQGADPGFKVSIIRDNLMNKSLVEWVEHSNTFQITTRGRQFVEKQLEFHATVYRPKKVIEMFYPPRGSVSETRTRRELTDKHWKIVPYKDCTDPIYDEIVRQVRESHL